MRLAFQKACCLTSLYSSARLWFEGLDGVAFVPRELLQILFGINVPNKMGKFYPHSNHYIIAASS